MSGTKKKGRIVEATGEDVRKYAASRGGEDAKEAARGADAAEPVSGAQPEGATELRDKLLRARAELANVQRRSAQEKSEAVRFAVADLARDLLGVVDDFGRALEAADAGGNEGIVEGARLAYENLMRILSAHQVERFVAEGEAFDPTCHEAVMQEPSADHPPQTVLREVQAGYRLAGRLLRPSKVVIASAPSEEGAVEAPED